MKFLKRLVRALPLVLLAAASVHVAHARGVTLDRAEMLSPFGERVAS